MSTGTDLIKRRQTAHDQSVSTGIGDITDFLRSLLGQRLVAHIAGIKDEKRVGRWIAGEPPSPKANERLRAAHRVAWFLMESGNEEEVVRAWFIGLNPQLNDVAPATALRDGNIRDVMSAADAFISGG